EKPQTHRTAMPFKPPPLDRWEGEGGAVTEPDPQSSHAALESPAPSAGHIVAAMGGGWELESFGHPVIDAYLRLHPERSEGNHLTLVAGPAVRREALDALAALVKGRPDIRIERYT